MATIQGYTVIDDSFRVDPILDRGGGYESRDYEAYPLNGLKCAKASDMPTLSESEIRERIAEKTANKTWVRDKCDQRGSPVKNQSNSSYCWIHAPVRGMEAYYVLSGGPTFQLSAFWAGSMIKNGRNQGGSGITGVEFMATHGTCREDLHPPMKFTPNRSADVAANAGLHLITEWEDLDPSDKLSIWTRIVLDIPVTVGIPAWGHEVLITFLVDDGGKITEGIDNSWGSDWGTNGRGLLQGRYARFDEAGAVRAMTPSAV